MRLIIPLTLLALLPTSAALAQDEPATKATWRVEGLPWSDADLDTAHLMSAHDMARGPEGVTLHAPPDHSPPPSQDAGAKANAEEDAQPEETDAEEVQPDTRSPEAPMPTGSAAATRVWLYARAHHLLRHDEPARAAALFELLAPQLQGAAPHLHLDAARAWAQADHPEAARAHLKRAATTDGPLPGLRQVTARVELASQRPIEALTQVLTAEVTGPRIPSPDTCAVIADGLEQLTAADTLDEPTRRALDPLAEALGLAAGACLRTPTHERQLAALEELRRRAPAALALKLAPTSVRAQLAAARVDYRDVRNDAAHDAYEAILKRAKGQDDVLCEANFKMAITLRRLKRRSKMAPFTAAATRHCTPEVAALAPELKLLRTRALYWGAMAAFKKDGKAARAHLTAILTESPRSRYADDALYHLARLAGRDEAAQLRERLRTEHPDGDMIVQLRWEPVQAQLDKERWERAAELLEEVVTHPPDATSHTQGRALYWLGYALAQQRKQADAVTTWKRCFAENPAAFHGHLCAQELLRRPVATGDWFKTLARPRHAEDVRFSVPDAAVRELIALGDFGRASQLVLLSADAPTSPRGRAVHDRWLAAWLAHLAGDYARSHQIPRRQLPGFPERYGMPTTQTRLLWEIAYPDPFGALVERQAALRGADPYFIRAIMREESAFDPEIVSWAGAVGLMQIMPGVGKGFGKRMGLEDEVTVADLKRPAVNMPIAATILASLGRRFDDHPVFMAAGYNAGPGAARKWRRRHEGEPLGVFAENIPYAGTRKYCRHVTGSYGVYQWLRGESPLATWALKVP